MTCEDCEKCYNYKACENGCYGSNKPCEYYTNRDEQRGAKHEI